MSQNEYLKNLKKRKLKIIIFQFLIFAMFLFIWEMAAKHGLIDIFFFSSPSAVCSKIYTMFIDGSLLYHTGTTFMETILSFLLVTILSIIFAILLWYQELVAKILEPFFVALNSLPKSALAPLLIVWLGTGSKTIIIAGISVAIFGSIMNLYTGFNQIDPDYEKLILTLGGTKKDIMNKIVFPYSVPLFITNMKINIGLCLVGVIIGEFLAARKGLGYQIIYGTQVFQLDLVITSIILLCAIATILYLVIHQLEKKYL